MITRSLELWGDGPGTANTPGGTILKPFNQSNPVFVIVPPVRNVHIRDMELRGTGTSGAGVGILCQSTVTNQAMVRGIRLNNLVINRFGSDGVRFDGYDSAGAMIDDVLLQDCIVELRNLSTTLRHSLLEFTEQPPCTRPRS